MKLVSLTAVLVLCVSSSVLSWRRNGGASMANFRSVTGVMLIGWCAIASAQQLQTPVKGLAVAKQVITGEQARELSRAIEQRPALTTLNIDPNKVAAAAGQQAPAV